MIDHETQSKARQWALALQADNYYFPGEVAAAETILALLDAPTVAETGWDASNYPMRGADTPMGRVVMIGWDDTAEYPVMVLDQDGTLDYMAADAVTPTNAWYELKEVRS